MKSLAIYFDELKDCENLKNDSEVAKLLKVTRSYISQVRSGNYMSDEMCFRLSILVNREPIELLSLNRAIREENKEVSKYWMKIHNKIKNNILILKN